MSTAPGIAFNDACIELDEGGLNFTLTGMFPLPKGGIVILTGPNGSGKTLTLSAIAAAAGKPDLGFVTSVEGATITGRSIKQIGLVRQEPLENFFSRIAADEIMLPLLGPGMDKNAREARLDKVLEHRDTLPLLKQRLSRLNSGAVQLLALLASSAAKPDVLLLDEPFSRMDSDTRCKAAKTIRTTCSDCECTAVIVSHEPDALIRLFNNDADQAVVLLTLDRDGQTITIVDNTSSVRACSGTTSTSSNPPGLTVSAIDGSDKVTEGDISITLSRAGRNLVTLDAVQLVKGVNLIAGPNASGKTLLGRVLGGMVPLEPYFEKRHQVIAKGEFRWCSGQSPRTLAKSGRSVFVPSEPSHWLVHETVKAELKAFAPSKLAEDVESALRQLSIDLDAEVDLLSYGQQKCLTVLGLPEALDLVILDEPFAHLSPSTSKLLADWCRARVDAAKWTCLVIATNRQDLVSDLFTEGGACGS